MNFIEELRWRGMLQDITPGTEEFTNKNKIAGYVGFDPTASSLHIGNLATIMLLVHLQRAGHKPFALVGGATGMIGDPSGKSEERKFLSEETLQANLLGIKTQLMKFLDFSEKNNGAEIVNNYDWFKEIGFLGFLREVGKHITISYMLAKDSVTKRLETGISFTEFSYQLLQGYDFFHLYTQKNVKLQMGGSDQWGNITTGTELIRRKSDGEAFALTCPLVTKADGSKFGKSESGNVWLDPKMTSPYKFYQFWLGVADSEVEKLLKTFTFIEAETLSSLLNEHHQAPHLRIAQKYLAEDITKRVHSAHDLQMAIEASDILFGKGTTETLSKLDEATFLSVFDGVPQILLSKEEFSQTKNITDLLSIVSQNQIFTSKTEARKMIAAGGISINKEKYTEPESMPRLQTLNDKYLLIQKGKKNYYLILIT